MFKVIKNQRLAKNFVISEFACPRSKDVYVDYELLQCAQKMRDAAGKPVIIRSGYRSLAYNRQIGGHPNSRHMQGQAIDVHVTGYKPEQIVKLAQEAGFNSIIIYDTFVHCAVGAARPTFADERVKNKNKPVERVW